MQKLIRHLPPVLFFKVINANRVCASDLDTLQKQRVKISLEIRDSHDDIEKALLAIENYETGLREHLDSKANSLLAGAAGALSALTLASSIAGASSLALSLQQRFILSLTLIICSFYWFSALVMVYESLKIVEFDVFCCASLQPVLQLTEDDTKLALARERWLNAKLNEPRFTMKSNWLAGARQLNSDGLILLLLGSVIFAVTFFFPCVLTVFSLPTVRLLLNFFSLFLSIVILPSLIVYECGPAPLS